MDQIKIGKFISQRRKEKNITQSDLAERLRISDRAVSKWENGVCLPDVSNIPLLCKILEISINDLFSGEIVDMKNKEKRLEKNLLDLIKQKEDRDKDLLRIEIICGILCLIPMVISIIVVSNIKIDEWLSTLIILMSLLPLLIATPFMIKIEQTAGYYECKSCGHRYIPTYTSVFIAAHICRTRYMKCPKCKKASWNKKVLNK